MFKTLNLLFHPKLPIIYVLIFGLLCIGLIGEFIYIGLHKQKKYTPSLIALFCLGLLFGYGYKQTQANMPQIIHNYTITTTTFNLDIARTMDSTYDFLWKNPYKDYLTNKHETSLMTITSKKNIERRITFFLVYQDDKMVILRSIDGDLKMTLKQFKELEKHKQEFIFEQQI